jgi:hypothetical protein
MLVACCPLGLLVEAAATHSGEFLGRKGSSSGADELLGAARHPPVSIVPSSCRAPNSARGM